MSVKRDMTRRRGTTFWTGYRLQVEIPPLSDALTAPAGIRTRLLNPYIGGGTIFVLAFSVRRLGSGLGFHNHKAEGLVFHFGPRQLGRFLSRVKGNSDWRELNPNTNGLPTLSYLARKEELFIAESPIRSLCNVLRRA